MTDDKIIKALECCSQADSVRCRGLTYKGEPLRYLFGYALDLINRQKAEIERLERQVHRLKKYDEERDIRLHARLTKTARVEAIKEFAERLKREKVTHKNLGEIVYVDDIDNLVKEMGGEQK